MGVAVLNPQDFLKDPFSRNSLAPVQAKYPRNPNPNSNPNKQKRPQPNRRRRSPPRHQASGSPPPPSPCASIPKVSKKKTSGNNHHLVVGQVRILKRGEEIAKTRTDLVIEDPDLGSTRRIGPDPDMLPIQTSLSDLKSPPPSFYAGPVTLTSPPPSDLPLPAFFTKKSVSVFKHDDATIDLIRILRLDIS